MDCEVYNWGSRCLCGVSLSLVVWVYGVSSVHPPYGDAICYLRSCSLEELALAVVGSHHCDNVFCRLQCRELR